MLQHDPHMKELPVNYKTATTFSLNVTGNLILQNIF